MTESIPLRTGTLTVEMQHETVPLAALCGFGARNNPKRGFLFVSKVLGKHWPSRPDAMLDAYHRLAQQLPDDLDGAVFIGMAETATGLGHGVFEAHRAISGVQHTAFVQTTRYVLTGAESIEFEEPHSHAAQQILYVPEDAGARDALQRCTTLVLVDDEISTGTTLCNLVEAARRHNAHIRRIVLVCLTDFSEGQALSRIAALAGIDEVRSVSLASGRFDFTPDPGYTPTVAAPAYNQVGCRRHLITPYSARLGTTEPLLLDAALFARCHALAGPNTLVVGTGEFMHAALCIARALEQHGITAYVQSTTRSPVLIDQDIRRATEVPDLYGEGISNFLYNFDRSAYDTVLVVHETPRTADAWQLCACLDAYSVCLADHTVTHHTEMSP